MLIFTFLVAGGREGQRRQEEEREWGGRERGREGESEEGRPERGREGGRREEGREVGREEGRKGWRKGGRGMERCDGKGEGGEGTTCTYRVP